MKLLVLATLCSLILCTSCMKKLSSTDSDGTPVTPTAVQDALINSWGVADPNSIRKNEFAYFEREQKIEDYTPKMILREGITVAERDIQTKQIVYKLLHQIEDLSGTQSKTSTTEESITIETDNGAKLAAQNLKNAALHLNADDSDPQVHQTALGVQIVQGLVYACLKAKDWDVECYDLKVSDETIAAPDLVAKQDNCAGLANCKLKVKNVSFFAIVKTTESDNSVSKQKIQYSIKISQDAPYLSRLMEYCYQGMVMVPSAKQKILVSICNRVKNFEVGEENPVL